MHRRYSPDSPQGFSVQLRIVSLHYSNAAAHGQAIARPLRLLRQLILRILCACMVETQRFGTGADTSSGKKARVKKCCTLAMIVLCYISISVPSACLDDVFGQYITSAAFWYHQQASSPSHHLCSPLREFCRGLRLSLRSTRPSFDVFPTTEPYIQDASAIPMESSLLRSARRAASRFVYLVCIGICLHWQYCQRQIYLV